MEYLEAIAIKRLNPDNLPRHLSHLPDVADRVIRRHMALVNHDTDAVSALELPVLTHAERARMNAVLIVNLQQEFGRLADWGGRRRPAMPIKPIEVLEMEPARGAAALPAPAGPGASARPWEQVR